MQLHFYPRPEGERLLFQGEMTNQNLKGVQRYENHKRI